MSKLKIFKFNHTLNVFQTIDVDADSYEEAEAKYLAEEEFIEEPRCHSHCFHLIDTSGEPNQNWEFIDETSGTYAFNHNFPVEQEIHIVAETLEEAKTKYEAAEFLWSAHNSKGVRVSDMYEETLSKEVEVVSVDQNDQKSILWQWAADEYYGNKVGAA